MSNSFHLFFFSQMLLESVNAEIGDANSMNYEIRAGVKPEINEDGWITGTVLGVNTDTKEFVAECGFEYNPKTDELSLHKYSEPGYFTGASYELEIPEFFKEHVQEAVDAIYAVLDDSCNKNIQYWYAQKYPEDTKSIADMNHEAEFSGLKKDILDGFSADDYLGISDPEFRNRVFEELSRHTGLSLDTIRNEPERTYKIYQLKNGEENHDYRFESLNRLRKYGLKLEPERYEEVYNGVMKPGEGLEDLYSKFNVNRPDDFKGHSMSVSDVVVINENGQDHAYFCDDIGFREVSEFVQGMDIETPSSDFIKDWYSAAFPTDDLAGDIDPEATFEGLKGALLKGEDVYEYLGVGDSVVRERVFQELADREGVEYGVIYDTWLSGLIPELSQNIQR